MATHSLKGTFDKLCPQNQCDVISQSMSTKFCIFVCYTKRYVCAKFEQNQTRNKEVTKMGNGVIVTSFLKIAQQFLVCEYFLLIPIVVPSFKLIDGQIKELQGVVPNTPGLRDKRMGVLAQFRPFLPCNRSIYAHLVTSRTFMIVINYY